MKKLNMSSKILFRVRKGDTLDDIAEIFDVTRDYILKYNDTSDELLQEGDVIFLPRSNIKIHVVQPLENLSVLAKKYNVDEQTLQKFNGTNTVFIGQKILIPQ